MSRELQSKNKIKIVALLTLVLGTSNFYSFSAESSSAVPITGTTNSETKTSNLIDVAKNNTDSNPYPQIYGRSLAPTGYVNFCRLSPKECDVGLAPRPASSIKTVQLNKQTVEDLSTINEFVNKNVIAISDQEQFDQEELWVYPTSGLGDCEDYVLEKRKMLIRAGWDESALLISAVYDEDGLGHAVLNVRTDKGDLVLDNRRDDIRFWNETNYEYVAQQSQRHPLLWVSLRAHDKRNQPISTAAPQ